ncbi:MAG: ribonuclease HII [Candidatus Pacebacteria bacterium]|nr:ribonuclease HII [Candidatus Paceibacterota bacterium]
MYIIGIDEVGRGPIAGPVVVCACAKKNEASFLAFYPRGILRDSKKLSEKQRTYILEKIQPSIIAKDLIFGVGESSAEYIDAHGIVPAIKEAMRLALESLHNQGVPQSSHIILDGALHAPGSYTQETVIKGDEKVEEISLASIYAKEYRDDIMRQFAEQYSEYGFESHVGYGTEAHYKALKSKGLSELHRKTFLKNFINEIKQ